MFQPSLRWVLRQGLDFTATPFRSNLWRANMKKRLNLYLLFVLILGMGFGSGAHAQASYDFTFFAFPGAAQTEAYAINDLGQIVGYYVAANADNVFVAHGFLYAGGSFTTIDFPGAAWTWAHGINNLGHIVGSYTDGVSALHGFLYSEGSFTSFDFPEAIQIWPYGINDSDQIVGTYTFIDNNPHGFLYEGGNFTGLDYPGANYTTPLGINNSGQIVGNYSASTEGGGFLYEKGGVTRIFFPGAEGTGVDAINNLGQILGGWAGPVGDGYFLYSEGVFTLIPPLPWPRGINNSGVIVGVCDVCVDDPSLGAMFGFIATPPPALTVTKAGPGNGTVTSIPAGIDCGPDCTETYNKGQKVQLTAKAEAGSTFAGWSGDCSGANPCVVTMGTDKTVTANFSAPGVPPGSLAVTPSSGLSASGKQGGPLSPSEQIYTLQNTGGTSINWTASKAQSWVTLSSMSGTLAAGVSTTVTVSVNDNANSLKVSLYRDTVKFRNTTNGSGNTSRPVTLRVNPGPQAITVATNVAGLEISVDGTSYSAPQTFNWGVGTSHLLSVSSPQSSGLDTRYVFGSWSDRGAQTHTIITPSSPRTYKTNFKAQYKLSASPSPSEGGTVNPSGSNWYDSGRNITISAKASPGYTFIGWSGDLTGATNPKVTTMNGPKTVTANFSNIALTEPNGGEVIASGSIYTIRWNGPSQLVTYTLSYSMDKGTTWTTLASNITGVSYPWAVPIPVGNHSCLVRVACFNSISGTKVKEVRSAAPFTIEVVRLTSPNGGEVLHVGDTTQITWKANQTKNPVMTVVLSYTTNGGTSWKPIQTLTGGYPPDEYDRPWTVPGVGETPTTKCKVKVDWKDAAGLTMGSDVSDAFFTISPFSVQEGSWRIETIMHGLSPFQNLYHSSSIGVGSNGSVDIAAAPCIGYNTPLVYAHKNSGLWSIEPRGYGNSPDIGIDSQGSVHLAYHPTDYPPLRGDGVHYALKSTDGWSDVKVESNSYSPSLTIDRSGIVHLAYIVPLVPDPAPEGQYTLSIHYASEIEGVWGSAVAANEILTAGDSADNSEALVQPKVAVDSTGHRYIAYVRSRVVNGNGFSELKLLTQTPGGWVSTVIDRMSFEDTSWNNILDMVTDGNDHLHIIYWDETNYFSDGPYVKYATNASGEWTTTLLFRKAWYPAIAVDKNNKVHIVYNTLDALKYASNVSGEWVGSTIATLSGDTLSDIVVDNAGRIHVSYYAEYPGLLRYATYPVTGVSIDKVATPEPATVTGTITYGMTVTNHGPDSTANVVVTDTLPDDVTFISSSASQGLCSGVKTVTCSLGGMAAGASATITVTVSINPTAQGEICNTASVVADVDPDASDNTSTACSTITRAKVTIAASDPTATEQGPTPGTFTVLRTDTHGDLTVKFSVGGTATEGTDYEPLPRAVTIPDKLGSAQITVNPKFDMILEGDETVIVALSPDPTYTVGSPESATVIIKDYIPVNPSPVGDGPRALALADLNGDGKLDLVVANMNANTVSVYKGDGAGGFGNRMDYPVGNGPRAVALGDLNGDGNPDLVVANADSNTVSVLLGDGAAGFGLKTDFSTGPSPRSIDLGELNGDGKLDLAIANYGSNYASVLAGDGSGGFGLRTDIATSYSAITVALGDLNGDGKLDMAVANWGSNIVSILLGDGLGGFEWKTNAAVGPNPISVALGDLNGDGNLDLLAANTTTNNISILLGDGTGNFDLKTNVATGAYPYAIALGDLNSDGKLDIVVANCNADTVSLFLGDGAGNVERSTDVAVGHSPVALAIGDLNGDKSLDIVVANVQSNTISILLNPMGSLPH
jgi:uncharacterized repeat protein (TIGR01451 family)/uncharacterized repeat protein (TIGR02543 family)